MYKNKAIYIIGDIHGNFKWIKFLLRHRQITDSILIQVGDFGVGFEKTKEKDMEDLLKLNEWVKEANCILYVIRGNHDDPLYFNGTFMFSHLKLLPDYTILNLEDKNVLFVGGAHSVDRGRRIRENDIWFPNEVFNLDEDRLIKMRDVDVVVTHSAPNFCWPMDFNQFVYNAAAEDGTLLDDLRKERSELTRMYELLEMENDITHWFYGHFHSSELTEFRGTDFRLLGIEEAKELR